MSRRAFTLIELLVVTGIIMVLLSILLPMVGRVRDAANSTKCQANVRTLTQAFLQFAQEHDSSLPGSLWMVSQNTTGNVLASRDHFDWLFGQYSMYNYWVNPNTGMFYTDLDRLQLAPQSGTIWRYVQDPNVYLCPSMTLRQPGGSISAGDDGTNGRFDYAAFSCFAGAPINTIQTLSDLHYALDPTNPAHNIPDTANGIDIINHPWLDRWDPYVYSTYVEKQPTPIVCQEDPCWFINNSPGCAVGADPNTNANPNGNGSSVRMDGRMCWGRRMAHVHNGGCWYGSIDGSVNWINEPDTDPDINHWWMMGASLWWQKGPSSHYPKCLNDDPGYHVNGWWGGWGYWANE